MGRKFPERTSVENSTMGSVGFYSIELFAASFSVRFWRLASLRLTGIREMFPNV